MARPDRRPGPNTFVELSYALDGRLALMTGIVGSLVTIAVPGEIFDRVRIDAEAWNLIGPPDLLADVSRPNAVRIGNVTWTRAEQTGV